MEERLMDIVAGCSPAIRACVASLGTAFAFLVGEPNTPLMALGILLIIDMLTRWMAIAKKTLDDEKIIASIWYGIYLSIHNKKITAAMLWSKFQNKVLSYVLLIIAFRLVDNILPDSFLGVNIDNGLIVFILSWLAFVELQSTIENLIECGFDTLRPLVAWCKTKRETLQGGADDASSGSNDHPDNG